MADGLLRAPERVAWAVELYRRGALEEEGAAAVAGMSRREFVAVLAATGVAAVVWGGNESPRRSGGRTGTGSGERARVRCLYNGYLLTADPARALDPDSTADRHVLYVVHAVLIDPDSGRIAATFPTLGAGGAQGGAQPAAMYAELAEESPAAPGIMLGQVIELWRTQGVPERLLEDLDGIDLNGAVVTPGLIDDHFHVTSWSKKLPAEGERFGFWADVGDIRFYLDPTTVERVCTRRAMWSIVLEANAHLADTGGEGLYLHGYLHTQMDDDPLTPMLTNGVQGSSANPLYLLNRIGRGAFSTAEPNEDPCTGNPDDWPPLPGEPVPALLVHTSGQACWYNLSLLELFNQHQQESGDLFESTVLTSLQAGEDESSWLLELAGGSAADAVLALEPPFLVDAVVQAGEDTLFVPFQVTDLDSTTGVLNATLLLQVMAGLIVDAEPVRVEPFWRPIPPAVTGQDWEAALEFAGTGSDENTTAYGRWDPRRPHETNWFNGAERGLICYQYDEAADVWRPNGYAEHYVMRDMLASLVIEEPTVAEAMEHRRRLASWCHRHGLTAVNDIMFYRRGGNTYEFDGYRGLSYDHRRVVGDPYYSETGLDPGVDTGRFDLRVGLYYYLENASEVADTLTLSAPAGGESDVARLAAPAGHPESPGWVRWLGWKLQLDGGTGARTLFSNALMPKAWADDPYETVDENGSSLTFLNHGFGLLTMTNVQEQVFSSRETAALYWLVRESDPASSFFSSSMAESWAWLREGVVGWLEREVDETVLSTDLEALDHVEMSADGAQQMADKVGALLQQVRSGWDRLLAAMVAIWYQTSFPAADGEPLPSQTVCHCIGDGAVDLYVHAIRRLRDDVEALPAEWEDLPAYWRSVVPSDADLSQVRNRFRAERFRVEHLLNVGRSWLEDIKGPGGLDVDTAPSDRNVMLSVQPSLLGLDGHAIRHLGFPYAQELWEIPRPDGGWLDVPSRPRSHHHMPCPLFAAHDIPYTLNTDPPSVRDPRPAVTVISSVARTPIEMDPGRWLDQDGSEPQHRPPDYFVHHAYAPLGLTTATPDNPMALTVEQALSAMTFWSAFVSGREAEIGAIAVPAKPDDSPGWHADLVVWAANPLAIRGPTGWTLDDVGSVPEGTNDEARAAVINRFIGHFRPLMTLVGGVVVYTYGTDESRCASGRAR